jgi:phytol kinase
MAFWDSELGSALIVAAVFLSLVGTGEILRGIGACSQEATRKFVHLTGGIVSLCFAYVFKSHWTILGLCVSFVSLMVITRKLGLLQSVHGIKRRSSGDLLHPIAIYLTFCITSYFEKPDFYLISIMVLSVSDALAAIIGVSYGFKVYSVEEDRKSLEGSFVFLLSTFLIVHLGLLLLTHVGRMECVLAALLISVVVTCFEAISLGGADNIIIPIGTLFIAMKITTKPIPEIILQLSSVGIIFLLTYLFGNYSRRLGTSGIIGVALAGYAAYSLVGPEWYIPVLICTVLISVFDIFLEMPGSQDELLRVRPIFYMFIVSFGWVLAANFNHDERQMFFVPYVVSFAAILSVRWKWYQREGNLISVSRRRVMPGLIAGGNFVIRAAFLSLAFLPLNHLIGLRLDLWFSMLTCFAGIIVSDLVYWGVGSRFHGQWSRVAFLRMGMASVLFASALVFAANLLYYR